MYSPVVRQVAASEIKRAVARGLYGLLQLASYWYYFHGWKTPDQTLQKKTWTWELPRILSGTEGSVKTSSSANTWRKREKKKRRKKTLNYYSTIYVLYNVHVPHTVLYLLPDSALYSGFQMHGALSQRQHYVSDVSNTRMVQNEKCISAHLRISMGRTAHIYQNQSPLCQLSIFV